METLTVTDFVLARLDEDEAAANLVNQSPTNRWPQPDAHAGELGVFYDQGEGLEIHTARVLAQCAAMRRIVHLAQVAPEGYRAMMTESLCALASIWSDHPDWREQWA